MSHNSKIYFLLSFVFLPTLSSTTVWAKTDADCELLEAVRRESIQDAKRAFKAGAHVDIKDDNDKTSLMIAIENEDAKMVKFLLDHKANFEIEDYNGWTALMYAVYYNDDRCECNKWRSYDDCNCCEYEDDYEDPINIVELLLEHGAHVNTGPCTPLMLAAAESSIRVVKILLFYGADPEMQYDDGFTALDGAALRGKKDIVSLLIEEDVPVTSNTLMLSLASNDTELIKDLFNFAKRRNIFLNAEQKSEALARLSYSLASLEVVEFLVDYGCDVNTKEINHPYTVLCRAIECGGVDIVKLLLDRGARIGAQELISACNNLEILQLLIDRGANLNLKLNHYKKETALVSVFTSYNDGYAKNGDAVIALLVKHGADVNIQGEDGWTALMFACKQGRYNIAKLLLDHGADVHAKNNAGYTALQIATENNSLDIVRLLLDYGA